jgi:DNA-binding MarR family transcriptional regulator
VAADLSTLVSDRLIHERSRLLILSLLASSEKRAVPFTDLKEKLELTAGNLSIQLKTLSEAGYVRITKEFRDNKPLTQATITAKGSSALKEYLSQMDVLIRQLG